MSHQQAKLKIDGMHCDACVRRLRIALEKLPSLHINDIAVGSTSVTYNPAETTSQQIGTAIEKIGFRPVTA
jgi:copper chaperone